MSCKRFNNVCQSGQWDLIQINPNPVIRLLEQSKTGRKHRWSGWALHWCNVFTGLGLIEMLLIMLKQRKVNRIQILA